MLFSFAKRSYQGWMFVIQVGGPRNFNFRTFPTITNYTILINSISSFIGFVPPTHNFIILFSFNRFDVLFVKVKSFQAPCCLVNEEFIAIYLFPLNRLRHRNELRNLCEIGTRAHAKLISAKLCAANINHSKHNYCCRSQRGTQTQQLMSSFLIIRGCQ